MEVRVCSLKECAVEMEGVKGGPSLVGKTDLVGKGGLDDMREDEGVEGVVSCGREGEGGRLELSEERSKQGWTMSVDEGLFDDEAGAVGGREGSDLEGSV